MILTTPLHRRLPKSNLEHHPQDVVSCLHRTASEINSMGV
jgi:hypothetical protein